VKDSDEPDTLWSDTLSWLYSNGADYDKDSVYLTNWELLCRCDGGASVCTVTFDCGSYGLEASFCFIYQSDGSYLIY